MSSLRDKQKTENGLAKLESKDASNKPVEGRYKDYNRQAAKSNTRLAVLNTAVELLKTHRKPIELAEVLSLAGELEQWALGQ